MAKFFSNLFSHIVHGEGLEDRARKPEIVEGIIKHTLSVADTGPISLGNAYEDRLREVLMGVTTADLETLRDRKITVCLDVRLKDQQQGWFDREVLGVFYNGGEKGGTIALWDSGKTSGNSGWFDRSAWDHGPKMLELFAEKLRDGDIDRGEAHYYAGKYSHYSYATKTYQSRVEWRAESDFDDGVPKKNPELSVPPLKKRPPGFSL